jgi:hypothetical protein
LAKKVYSRKEHTKISKSAAKFGCEIMQNAENIALQSSQILYTFVLRARKLLLHIWADKSSISARNTKVYRVAQKKLTCLICFNLKVKIAITRELRALHSVLSKGPVIINAG